MTNTQSLFWAVTSIVGFGLMFGFLFAFVGAIVDLPIAELSPAPERDAPSSHSTEREPDAAQRRPSELTGILNCGRLWLGSLFGRCCGGRLGLGGGLNGDSG